MNQQLVDMVFSKYKLNKPTTLQKCIEMLWEMNMISVGEMAERAISKNSNLVQNSRGTKGSDFDDMSDSKYITVNYYKSAYATLCFKHKIGKLRVCCYEPKTKTNYYFIVPHKVYAPYQKKNDSLKVWFDLDGNPRRPSRNTRVDLWDHVCSIDEWAGAK